MVESGKYLQKDNSDQGNVSPRNELIANCHESVEARGV